MVFFEHMEAATIADGDTASKKGTAALKKWYDNLNERGRALVEPYMKQYRKNAKDADKKNKEKK